MSGEGRGGLDFPVSLFRAGGTSDALMDRWDVRSVAAAGSAWWRGMPEPHPEPHNTVRPPQTCCGWTGPWGS